MNLRILTCTILLLGIFSCVRESYNLEELQSLAYQFYEYEKIIEISDCTRRKKVLNGVDISFDTLDVDANHQRLKPRFYKNVLKELNIEERDFNFFVKEMQKNKFIHYYRKDDYSIFTTFGMLGEISGVLVDHNQNDTFPTNGFRLNSQYYIWPQKKLDDNIYTFQGQ